MNITLRRRERKKGRKMKKIKFAERVMHLEINICILEEASFQVFFSNKVHPVPKYL